jgi:hypothetical protein
MAKYSVTGVESGASDLGALVKVGGEHLFPFGNGPNDILQRHRAAQDGVDTFPASRVMEGGNRYEDVNRLWFEDDFGVKVKHPKKGYRNKHCNLVASLDGLIEEKKPFTITDHQGLAHTLEGRGVIDFKSPTYTPDDPEGLHYILQVQGQMDCAGADWAIIAYLPRVNLEWVIAVTHRHTGMIKAIHEAVDTFWLHMEKNTDYPPATTAEANRLIGGNRRPDALDLVEGCPDDSPIDRNGRDELMNLAESYFAGVKTKKAGENLKEESQLAIQQIMNGVERVGIPGVNIKWTTMEYRARPKTATVVLDGLKEDELAAVMELADKVKNGEPAKTGRRFSAKEVDDV